MNYIIVSVFTIFYLLFTLYQCKNYQVNIKELAIGGIACALTVVLNYIYIPIPTGVLVPVGAAVPLIVLAIVCDYRLAMISGWVSGILCLILVPAWQPIHWAQVFSEHLVCLSCLGYAGIFGSGTKTKMIKGVALALGLQFIGHVLSGVVFFSAYVWEGWNVWTYSIVYNFSSWLPGVVITSIILRVIPLESLKSAYARYGR